MTNAPALLARLQDLARTIESGPTSADQLRTASRGLADTAAAESPEIAAAGRDLATAAEGDMQDSIFHLCLRLRVQTLMARIQTAAELSQAGRIWAAGQNLAEFLLAIRKFLGAAPQPRWSEEFPPAICSLEAVRLEFGNFVAVLGWPPPEQFGLQEDPSSIAACGAVDRHGA